MTTLHGLQSGGAGAGTRELAPEPENVVRAQEMYAAWKAIFENARPAHPGPGRSRPDREQVLHAGSDARPETCARDHSQNANGSNDATGNRTAAVLVFARAAARAGPAAAESMAARARVEVSQVAEVAVAAAPITRGATCAATADVAVRIHYLHSECGLQASASSGSQLQPEVVSIILEGADVSIIVRDARLTEAQALRTAFETARELTGRTSSLRELTLNGRVLYQHASQRAVDPSGDVLFAC